MEDTFIDPSSALSMRVLPTRNLGALDISPDPFAKSRIQGRRFELIHATEFGHTSQFNYIFRDVFENVKALAKEHIRTHNRDELETTLTFIAKMKTAESSIPTPERSCLYVFLTAICRFFGKTPWFWTYADRLTKLENQVKQEIANLKKEEETNTAELLAYLQKKEPACTDLDSFKAINKSDGPPKFYNEKLFKKLKEQEKISNYTVLDKGSKDERIFCELSNPHTKR